VPLKKPQKPQKTSSFLSKFVVLGEDDPDDEELLKEVFQTVDPEFSVIFFNNGRKLMEELRQMQNEKLPCLIILDYNMPEMNGAEILQELKGLDGLGAIPKIIWSTSGSDTYRKHCLMLGASDYITKPSNIHGLEETVRYMLSFC
jgi:DNA-binding response OmpR family regulator